ncbi:GNAT family N-acetyltransferase [Kineococcus rhizosphaerae]|uniref:Acetyltransferase (GNAT) family protein n=1 Tax=Kineococcus rhizosphaerae TaxID=559628 RepID=A0A2T0QYV5_9ACTN|nr:GNAT family N-acetyltransferase [Kineococcus rhizosphaerae]PRY11480.1 acetyltransferase (GNAT) family protein [Kineococcus rhizosphaerae]
MAVAPGFRALTVDDLADLGWAGSGTHLRAVRAELTRGDEVDYLAAVVDGRVVGVGAVDHVAQPGRGALFQLVVHPGHRSRGVGTALVGALEDAVRARGGAEAVLEVEVDNPRAQALYERLGYRRAGTTVSSWTAERADRSTYEHRARCRVLRRALVGDVGDGPAPGHR